MLSCTSAALTAAKLPNTPDTNLILNCCEIDEDAFLCSCHGQELLLLLLLLLLMMAGRMTHGAVKHATVLAIKRR